MNALGLSCIVVGSLFRGWGSQRSVDGCRDFWLVPYPCETIDRSAELDIRPGLDFTLHSDGNFGMAHRLGFRVAAANVGPLALCRSTGIELSVAMDLFPASRDRRGASRACCSMDGNCGHDNCVWIGLAPSGLADGTVPGLGNFRMPVERGVLAAESESRLEPQDCHQV